MSRAKKAFAHQVGIERRRGSSGERILASCWLLPVNFDRPCLSLARSQTRYLRFSFCSCPNAFQPTSQSGGGLLRLRFGSRLRPNVRWRLSSWLWFRRGRRRRRFRPTTDTVTVRYQSNAFREARRRGEAVEKVASTVYGNTKTGMAYMLDYWRANHHVASHLRPCQFKRTCTACHRSKRSAAKSRRCAPRSAPCLTDCRDAAAACIGAIRRGRLNVE